MNENSVVSLRQKDEIDDPLTEILRTGARRLITRAVEVEFDTFLALNSDLALPDGRQRVVRHGHDPVRTIQTGIGPVKVQKPKARDRSAPEAGERTLHVWPTSPVSSIHSFGVGSLTTDGTRVRLWAHSCDMSIRRSGLG